MIRRFPILLIIVGLLSSFCVDKNVDVSFKNGSSETFKELHVWIFNKKFNFYNIKPGEATNEINIPAIYNTCTVQVITSKGKLLFMPIDHVGETATTIGKKIFTLTILTDSTGKRKLELQ